MVLDMIIENAIKFHGIENYQQLMIESLIKLLEENNA
jgi:hypothetical protein